MKSFYKIENKLPIVGSGTVIPEGFTEYEVGQEPTELANALILQQEQENMAKEVADKKAKKELRLSQIFVTTSTGNVFDGNETARNNMVSSIMSADLFNKSEEYWKLADNSIKLVSLDELKEALALSIQEVGNIVKDY